MRFDRPAEALLPGGRLLLGGTTRNNGQAAPLGLELLHDLQECIIYILLVCEAVLDLPQVG
jgi:hypothetical protein